MSRCGKKQARNRDGKQQNQRQHIVGKLLDAPCSAITASPPKCEKDTDQHHDCADVEDVERQRSKERIQRKTSDVDAKNEGLVDPLIFAACLEANPAERKGKRNGCGKNTTPRQEPMCSPARLRPTLDEALQYDIVPGNANETRQICRKATRFQEDLPSAKPIHPRRRAAQPHSVAVAKAESCKDSCARVGDKSGIEIPEAAAADDDADDQQNRSRKTPKERVRCIGARRRQIDRLKTTHDSICGCS